MQDPIVYRQIPVYYTGTKCYFCKTRTNRKEKVRVLAINQKMRKTTMVKTSLLYCNKCNLCFATPEMIPELLETLPKGYSVSSFLVTDNEKLQKYDVRKKAFQNPDEYNKIYNISPVKKKKEIDVSESHDRFPEISHPSDFDQHHGEMEKVFQDDPNAQIMIILGNTLDKNMDKAVIISDHTMDVTPSIHILDYTVSSVRQFLALVFHYKKKSIVLDQVGYLISENNIIYKNGTNKTRPNYIVRDIVIRDGGGYHYSIKSNRYEIVDVLMFSPFEGNYEVVRATYDKEKYDYFIDISVFRRFVREYGNPGIELRPSRTSDYNFEGWREEAFLHMYGYNVDEREGLSSGTRQKILAEIIDLELMTQKEIIFHLQSVCIAPRINQSKYINACNKWQEDINFVINYKANPQRFIIAR